MRHLLLIITANVFTLSIYAISYQVFNRKISSWYLVVQFLTISFVFFLALITPVFMLVCAFGECWRVCKQLVGCFLKCFDGSSSFWSLDGLVICFANFPWISCCFFTLFGAVHFTYYIFIQYYYNCNFVSFVSTFNRDDY